MLTSVDMAERTGVTQPMVYLWESGKNLPSDEHFDALSFVLGVSVACLMVEPGVEFDIDSLTAATAVPGEFMSPEDSVKFVAEVNREADIRMRIKLADAEKRRLRDEWNREEQERYEMQFRQLQDEMDRVRYLQTADARIDRLTREMLLVRLQTRKQLD